MFDTLPSFGLQLASSFACDRDTCEVVKLIIVNYNRTCDTHTEVLLEHSL